MKRKLIILSIFTLLFGAANAQALPEETNAPIVGEAADESPEYPGGAIEMMKFIKANTKYPQSAASSNITGKCAVKFMVNPDGSISDVTVLEGIKNCPDCDTEAIRVVKSMPKWKPGRLAGKSVALFYNVSVHFSQPKK
ncbi:MAG TPA: energy transducer TonB [Bacteroidia bacterium]|jgi:protein TonB|nr:energy transducer TonB [Bacteroidia bacterium]